MYPAANSVRPVEEVIVKAHRELLALLQERARVVERIGTVKQTIAGLANVFGEDLLSDELLALIDRKRGVRHSGLTRTCRATLMESETPLTPQNICHEIRRRQPSLLAHHKSPLASITTIMNRLVQYGEARVVTTPSGRRAWQWATGHREEVAPITENHVTPVGPFRQPIAR